MTGDANNNAFFAAVADGNDSYTGGAGTDTYDLSGTVAGTTVNLGLGTATGLDTGSDALVSIENVVGSAGNNCFVAAVGDGSNSYTGGAGIDTYDLSATSAATIVNLATGVSMIGGAGNDTYFVDNAGDIVSEVRVLDGLDTVSTTLNSYTLSANVDNLTFVGIGSFAGTGNNLANVIIGGAGNDTLSGLQGDGT